MGLTCSSAAQGLSFQPYSKGCNILLNNCFHQAKRLESFHDGIVFSNRPLLPGEKVWIRILEVEQRWHGALRIGFTSVNPCNIDSNSLPPFACPNLTNTPGFWALGIPEELCMEGKEICFWINKSGQVLYKKMGNFKPKKLLSGLPKMTKLWVMIDVYGQTKALQLLDVKTRQPFSPCCGPGKTEPQNMGSGPPQTTVAKDKALYPPQSEQCMETSTKLDLRTGAMDLQPFKEEEPACVICQDRIQDTLLLPCRHCSFCKPCVLKIRGHNNTCPLCRQRISFIQGIRERRLLDNSDS